MDPGWQRADILALAIRFAHLWAVDPHQMVDEIYAPSIHMESMARPTVIDGSDMLHQVEDRLAAMIPEHRHELVRVLIDPPSAFLETTVVGPTTGEYAQAALWWRLDEPAEGRAVGQVGDEIGWFDWSGRRADYSASLGAVPPDDRRWRGGPDWYERLVREAAAAFADSPSAAAGRYLAADSIATHVGHIEIRGRRPVMDVLERFSTAYPERRIEISRVIGDGAVVAVLFNLDIATSRTRGTLVATLDAAEAALSVRLYLDWAGVVAGPDQGPRFVSQASRPPTVHGPTL
jgi:predicted SnoaL-like aldol condensation-catalyzing enzyme